MRTSANVARIGAHLTGRMDVSGRAGAWVERGTAGLAEHHGPAVRQLHQRHINGHTVFRVDTK